MLLSRLDPKGADEGDGPYPMGQRAVRKIEGFLAYLEGRQLLEVLGGTYVGPRGQGLPHLQAQGGHGKRLNSTAAWGGSTRTRPQGSRS
jgi:hypothetical protein